jgi:general secretion pathway protein K
MTIGAMSPARVTTSRALSRHAARTAPASSPDAAMTARTVSRDAARTAGTLSRDTARTAGALSCDAAKWERGFALLIVLWTLALLSFLVMQMVAAARTEATIAFNLRSNMGQEADADGAIYAAAFHLLDRSDKRWNVDGTTYELAVPGGTVAVRITDEADKVNLNTASADLLRAVLLGVGTDATTASTLAGAIVDWRGANGQGPPGAKALEYRAAGLDYAPPEKPFRSPDELGLVLGMAPDLLARLRPHLTIYSTYGPGRASTDPVALDAIMLLRGHGGVLPFERDASGTQVVQVIAAATGADGAAFTRRAILRLDPSAKDRPFAILAWEP